MADKKQSPGTKTLTVGLELVVPEGMPIIFANQTSVINTQNEFILCFFQAHPPLAGVPESGKIKAHCIAQIAIAPGHMGEFVDQVVRSFQGYSSKPQKPSRS